MKKLKSMLSAFGMFLLVVVSIVLWIVLPWPVLLALFVVLVLWMSLTRIGRQAAAVTWVGVSTLSQRLGASSVIVVGIAGVVGVLVALLAMGDGLQKTLQSTGDVETAIVMRGGASNELSSGLSRDDATLIAQAAGILRDAEGKPIISSELVVVANLPKKSTGTDANVEIRGVGAQAWALGPNVKIVEGRKFTPGMREMIVGKGARQQFAGVEAGSKINLNNQQWDIVGVFESATPTNRSCRVTWIRCPRPIVVRATNRQPFVSPRPKRWMRSRQPWPAIRSSRSKRGPRWITTQRSRRD